MEQTQGTLIYIEKENITEAEFMSRNFVNREVKNKAYLNTLGAEIISKYLTSEGFNLSELHNIHSISKILEVIDIADILLPNIHIDVRVVFNKEQIFIPKSHFNLEIVPDIYAVVIIDKEFKQAEFLGFFKPSEIDKQKQNSQYYFISEKELTSPNELTQFIKNFPGKTLQQLSEEDFLKGRELSVSLADHNISEDDKRELLHLLLTDSALRESVIEFDNFETLSYSAAPELSDILNNLISVPAEIETNIETNEASEETATDSISEEIQLEEPSLDEELNIEEPEEEQTELIEENEIENSSEEEILEENHSINTEEIAIQPDTEEANTEIDSLTAPQETQDSTDNELSIDIESSPLLDMEDIDLGDDMLGSDLMEEATAQLQETELIEQPVDEPVDETKDETIEEETIIQETIENPVNETITDPVIEDLPSMDLEPIVTPQLDLSVDSLLDQTIAAIGQNIAEKEIETTGIITAEATGVIAGAVGSVSAMGIAAAEAVTGESLELPTKEETETLEIPDTEETSEVEPTKELEEIEEADETNESEENDQAQASEEITTEASDEAIKLASVSGDVIDNVIAQNIEQQQKRLDKIDYAKTDIAPDTTEIPEHIQALGTLSAVKRDADLEAELSGEFDGPTDLSELNKVETYEEEVFEQETIDIGTMETIETEDFTENTDEIVDLSNITDINSPTKPLKDIENLNLEPEIGGMDLPDLSSYTINDDGTSSIDNFGMDLDLNNSAGEEHLVDIGMKMNLTDLSVDDDAFDIGEVENLENEEHLNDIPAFQNSNKIEAFDETENPTENTEEIIITDAENEPSEMFDEISLEDFENFANETEEIETVETDQEETINKSDETIEDIEEELQTETELQNEEIATEEQEWLDDTDFDDLETLEQAPVEETVQEEITDEVLISEPALEAAQTFETTENSRVISDRTFQAGEIPIDINNPEQTVFEGPESLESIYDQENKVPGAALLQTPGRLGTGTKNKSGLGVGLGIVGTLIALALVGVIGFSVAKMFKAPAQDSPQPITDDTVPTSTENGITDTNTLNVDPNNVVNMDENTNALASTTQQPAAKNKPATANTAQPTASAPAAKKMPATSFIEIKKLTWEVPDYISYNQQFKQYFQSVGKSLKLSLGSDLLLATDPIYSNQVRVSVTFNKDGSFKTSQIIVSSGSTQIDKIVLQTVNQTLKVLKAPHSVGNDESTTVILKIYF